MRFQIKHLVSFDLFSEGGHLICKVLKTSVAPFVSTHWLRIYHSKKQGRPPHTQPRFRGYKSRFSGSKSRLIRTLPIQSRTINHWLWKQKRDEQLPISLKILVNILARICRWRYSFTIDIVFVFKQHFILAIALWSAPIICIVAYQSVVINIAFFVLHMLCHNMIFCAINIVWKCCCKIGNSYVHTTQQPSR